MDQPRPGPGPSPPAQLGCDEFHRYSASISPFKVFSGSLVIAYWISDAFNVSTWQFASSMLAVGLSFSDALIIVAVSFLIISVVIAANGAVGATYHIPFPVIARASWGFWGSYVAIISRLILALFWFAIHNVNGGNAVKVMIGAIWPSFLDIENRIPQGQGTTTIGMVGYVVYWAVQFPLLCIRPDRVRWVFLVKSVLVPVAWVAMLVWAFVAEGGGDLFEEKGSRVRGSRYSWLFLANMTSVLGNYATTSVNQVCPLPYPLPYEDNGRLTGVVRLLSLLAHQRQMAAPLRPHAPHRLHLHLLHRRRRQLRRSSPLRRRHPLGSHSANKPLVQPRLSLLRGRLLRPRLAGREYLGQLHLSRE